MTTMEEVMQKPLPHWWVRTVWGSYDYYGVIDYDMLKQGILMFFTPDNRLLAALDRGAWQQFAAVYKDAEGSDYFPVDKPEWGPTGNVPEQIASDQGTVGSGDTTQSDLSPKVVQLRPRGQHGPAATEPPPPPPLSPAG